jgi:protein TonB
MAYRFPNLNGALRVFTVAKPIDRVEPVYPPAAKAAGITGTVTLFLLLTTDGHVQDVHVDSGPEQLVPAAVDAVKQWVFSPMSVSGRALEVETPVRLKFGDK